MLENENGWDLESEWTVTREGNENGWELMNDYKRGNSKLINAHCQLLYCCLKMKYNQYEMILTQGQSNRGNIVLT